MLHHAVGINAETRLALRLGLETGPDVHAARIEPCEEWLSLLVRAVDEVERCLQKLLVDGFHALLGERAGVVAALPAPFAKAWVFPGVSVRVAVHLRTPRGPKRSLNSVFFG